MKNKTAFLTATFPTFTETFILREYLHLAESEELDVKAFAVRRPVPEKINKDYADLVQSTFYLRPDHLIGAFVANIITPFLHPIKYAKALSILASSMPSAPVNEWHQHIFHFTSGVYLSRYLRKHNFTTIHSHFRAAGNIGLFASLLSGINYVTTFHAGDDLYKGLKPYLEKKIQTAKTVITNNKYNVFFINLLTFYKYSDKIKLIYNGLDTDSFDECQEKSSINGPTKLLTVGAFRNMKGYPIVLTALQEIKKRGINFEYHIVGDGDPREKTMIEDMIKQYNMEEQVKLLGILPFSEVRKELQWCDIKIMNCSTSEAGERDGLPNAIIEAMLSKRVVVSTYLADIPNVIEDKVTGYIIPENNPDKLTDTLEYIINNFEETTTITRQANKLAKQLFNAKTNYEALINILK